MKEIDLLQQLQDEYEEDIKWSVDDSIKLSAFINTIPYKIAKYQNKWFRYKNALDKISKEIDDLYSVKFLYYKKDFDINLSNSEIKDFISKDVELNSLRLKAKTLTTLIEFLEKIMKNIDSIRWDIKLMVEYQKFISGVLS
jgi:hypothetical protein